MMKGCRSAHDAPSSVCLYRIFTSRHVRKKTSSRNRQSSESPMDRRQREAPAAVPPRPSGGAVVLELEVGRAEVGVGAEEAEDAAHRLLTPLAQLVAVDDEDLLGGKMGEVLLELEPVTAGVDEPVVVDGVGERARGRKPHPVVEV